MGQRGSFKVKISATGAVTWEAEGFVGGACKIEDAFLRKATEGAEVAKVEDKAVLYATPGATLHQSV